MGELVRFGVSMEEGLVRQFDALTERRGYRNRSEALRDMVRRELVRRRWEDPEARIVGTLTLVYDHHVRELDEQLVEKQHQHHEQVVCVSHVHLTRHHCLEVLVARGRAREVQRLADELIAVRGVLHGELVATTTGEFAEGDSAHAHGDHEH